MHLDVEFDIFIVFIMTFTFLSWLHAIYVHSLHYSFYFFTFLSIGQMHSNVYIFPGLCVMLTLNTYSIYILDESSKTMAN